MSNICVVGYMERDDNKILLVQHAYGHQKWHLPGGAVKESEGLEEALIRECKEETGFDIQVECVKGAIYSPKNFSVAFVYKISIVGGFIRNDWDEEIKNIGFFSLDNLPRHMSDYALYRISLFKKEDVTIREWELSKDE